MTPVGFLDWLGFGRRDLAVTDGVLSPWADDSHLADVTWANLISWESAHMPVTRAQAMAIPTVARGRQIITGQVARLALASMTGDEPSAQVPAWISQPERHRARALTLTWLVDAMIFYGRGWLVCTERYATGWPARWEWVPEHLIDQTPDGRPLVAGRALDPRDVVRIDGPHEGLLAYGQEPLRDARAARRAAGRAMNNPVPSIELHQIAGDKMSEPEITSLINRWAEARAGKNGGVAFTNKSLEARVHGQAAEQLLIAGQNASALDLTRAMNLPAWAADVSVSGSSLTYTNVAARAQELLDITLAPYLDAITGRLSMDDILPRGTWCRFTTEQLTAPDFKSRMDGYQAAITAGIYTVEECRAIERGTPLENPAQKEIA